MKTSLLDRENASLSDIKTIRSTNCHNDGLRFLNTQFGLSDRQLEQVIDKAIKQKRMHAFCDVFFQVSQSQSLVFDDNTLKKTKIGQTSGAGVRVVLEDKTGYSYTDSVNFRNLIQSARDAGTISEFVSANAAITEPVNCSSYPHLYLCENGLGTLEVKDKLNFLSKVDEFTRKFDNRIVNCSVSLDLKEETIVIADSHGRVLIDQRPLLKLSITCLSEENGRREKSSNSCGGRLSFASFLTNNIWQECAEQTARQAIERLSAVAAPAGEMIIVLGNGWPGVLFHEAVGHGLEGDFNRKQTSAFSKLMGQKVASELCTVVDDGTIPHSRGSLNFDDEGNETRTTVLIENGILKQYMHDRMNGHLMRQCATGNGRRQSYRCAPMPRMTNTFLAAGTSTPEEIIGSVRNGLYVESVSGGQVDITTGNFTFAATSAFLIENGKVGRPVKGATLIGNGPKSLHAISMVGNDLKIDTGTATCSKRGQSVPVGVGAPTIRLDQVTVGGTKRQ